jgi:hypothetical protein
MLNVECKDRNHGGLPASCDQREAGWHVFAAAHALADAILYWRETGQDISALLEEAATPGGTSATTLAPMDAANQPCANLAASRASLTTR